MILDPDACYHAIQARDARFDGRFFTGVITTGIYCRPICPARTPKRENVTFFASAAAAEAAAFRACLRCRPETSPDLGAWRGTSSTVSRALALIEEGALDDRAVDRLAERLGIGERQLRRLFRQHLGASPIAVAQTRRVLLAKQLIQDTGLSMAEVAMASGFGSIRRFNETFRALYGRPPAELRHRRMETSRDALTLTLAARTPYDWGAMIAFLAERAIPGVERVEGDRYMRTVAIGGDLGTIMARAVADARLRIDIRFPRLAALPTILARVRRRLDLASDPEAIVDHLAQDERLKPLVAARPGLRAPGPWNPAEATLRASVETGRTAADARTMLGEMARGGLPLPGEFQRDGLDRVLPEPPCPVDQAELLLPAADLDFVATLPPLAAAWQPWTGHAAMHFWAAAALPHPNRRHDHVRHAA